jgi:AbrB family looped-hinge helix DNA binding protein
METTIQVNRRGTLTLPKNLRKAVGLEEGGSVIAELSDSGIVLRPSVTFPIEIYADERIREFDEADAELGRRLGRTGA